MSASDRPGGLPPSARTPRLPATEDVKVRESAAPAAPVPKAPADVWLPPTPGPNLYLGVPRAEQMEAAQIDKNVTDLMKRMNVGELVGQTNQLTDALLSGPARAV